MIGKTLGRYTITAEIGKGGMGAVYRARDTLLKRDVAIKVLAETSSSGKLGRDHLLQEARTASALNHPHVCTIHEVGEADGEFFIVMELVEGKPLSDVIGAAGLSIDAVTRYSLQIAEALAHAHDRGIIHRDLKSSNIVITPEGRAEVLDFGLARYIEKDEVAPATKGRTGKLSSRGCLR